ncbi:MAG: 1-(5-phosphoribosyl)-5-[(5-phosphoribosylamino)methylideneamino] imidazole-4-carboxamide isomerase [Methanocalculus sp. MSAO_Arc1]|uniref:1-(5-phosphoribosyl)-5-[(5- phosphoribosylamino)methylideneamino]imidazole-4- carboxamide isomerase n=1 Tax=Methanocalculus TaxID=71151 RepID=UPI000FF32649|nr:MULTISPECIES: 1-(5-phosphoribosyl)-5-[(5-phosphoribosylamino)methylideneamino]imidazole-4-carboxamide isomerase [unclassified Methanocalculus]MCP1663214.1 phosphoribosylformimino-5-aminoimidazole carboxamide ribotide isomerase [Methanocalculus sp. AMF5]RQD80712.1 MAG: 1-(5-phosphoribosyl)-5-[(5-phosphoribosylamino)methylideneamino] imidazole-4-carboxamide isomerase [Methanocalculus sp. MSAO_Arc1]
MDIFPAVDILNGRCVQLVQGKRETAQVYGSPLDAALRWIDEGATALHIVNLDGAFGNAGANAEIIRQLIAGTDVFIQLGGGIRSASDAAGWLDIGVDRVILGTAATEDPFIIRRLSQEHGSGRIMAGVDARGGEIAIHGWEQTAGDAAVWAARFEQEGAGSLLFTNVDVEGLCSGIDAGLAEHVIRSVQCPVVVSGGVSSAADLRVLRELGAAGVVLGSALYSGMLSLPAILEEIS